MARRRVQSVRWLGWLNLAVLATVAALSLIGVALDRPDVEDAFRSVDQMSRDVPLEWLIRDWADRISRGGTIILASILSLLLAGVLAWAPRREPLP